MLGWGTLLTHRPAARYRGDELLRRYVALDEAAQPSGVPPNILLPRVSLDAFIAELRKPRAEPGGGAGAAEDEEWAGAALERGRHSVAGEAGAGPRPKRPRALSSGARAAEEGGGGGEGPGGEEGPPCPERRSLWSEAAVEPAPKRARGGTPEDEGGAEAGPGRGRHAADGAGEDEGAPGLGGSGSGAGPGPTPPPPSDHPPGVHVTKITACGKTWCVLRYGDCRRSVLGIIAGRDPRVPAIS